LPSSTLTQTLGSFGSLVGTGNDAESFARHDSYDFGFSHAADAGTATVVSSGSYSDTSVSSSSLTQTYQGIETDSYQGSYISGTAAYSSVVFQSMGTTTTSELATGTDVFSSTSSVSEYALPSSTLTQTLGSAGNLVGTGNDTYNFAGNKSSTVTQTANSSTSRVDTGTLYAAGKYANGSYSFSSLLSYGGGTSSGGEVQTAQESYSGSSVVTDTAARVSTLSASYSGSSISGLATSSTNGADAYSYCGLTPAALHRRKSWLSIRRPVKYRRPDYVSAFLYPLTNRGDSSASARAIKTLRGATVENKALVVQLTGSNARESNELAAGFQRIAARLANQVKREKENTSTQDLGASLLLIFGSGAAAVALANGLADWLRNHRKAKLEIRSEAGDVIATELTSADAVRIVEIITTKAPPAKAPPA
jgi:hypothetical protein